MAARRILITGSTGLLGLALKKERPGGFDIYAGYYNFPKEALPQSDAVRYVLFDITDTEAVFGIFKEIMPEVVIHAASCGNVDYCERNRQEAWRTNVEGSRNVIEACRRYKARLIFTSSNAVFDGENPPYTETDKPNPIDYYGKTKLQTELDLSASGLAYCIARLMTMYGWNHPLERQNPVTWILGKLSKGERLNIVEDIYNNHLFADNAAQAIWAIVTKDKQGIFHIAGSQVASRYELACDVADIFGFDKHFINPVKSSFFPSIAPRPKNTSYNIDKMERELSVGGIAVQEGLTLMKDNQPEGWKYAWWK